MSKVDEGYESEGYSSDKDFQIVNETKTQTFSEVLPTLEKVKEKKERKKRAKKDLSLSETQEKELNKIYYEIGLYYGRDRLFNYLQDHHPDLQISRRMLANWLKKQELNQLFRSTRKTKYVKATVLKSPFKQVAIDLADMQNNEYLGHNYILTGIDLFSKKGYAVAIKNKEGATVARAFELMLKQMVKPPSTVRHDVGSEFKDENFQQTLKNNNIKQIFSNAGKPWSNGGVERFNKTLKNQLRMHMTAKNTEDWLSFLPNFLVNYNESRSSVTKISPNDVELSFKEEDEDVIEGVQDNIKKAVLPKNEDISKPKFNVGDKVRLKVVRKENQKSNGRNWTQDIYTIYQRGIPRTNTSAPFYKVEDDNKKYTERLYENDLQLVTDIEHKIVSTQKYDISKIVKPSLLKVNGVYKQYYEIAWKNKRKKTDNTLEPREKLILDIPKQLKAWEETHEVEWGKTTVKYKTIEKQPKKKKEAKKAEPATKEAPKNTRRGRTIKPKEKLDL